MRRLALVSAIATAIPFAVCSSAQPENVALAACAFALPTPGADNLIEIQVTPDGEFKPSDGRDMKVPAWRMNAAVASSAIARFNARKTKTVIDYEHQTLRKEENGQPAPAAAWLQSLEYRPGQGLFAKAELTQRAREAIAAGEYRYFSPVFTFDPATGDVLDVRMGALTNSPAIDGMEPLSLRAAATFGIHNSTEVKPMNRLLLAMIACSVLGLGKDSTEDQAIAALSALQPKLDEAKKLREALGIGEAVASDAAITACTAIKTKADAGGTPDPAKYVPIGVVEEIRTQLAALSSERLGDKVGQAVEAGLADGRLLAAQKDWALDLGKKDFAALTKYLETAQPIAALTGLQTNGRHPVQAKNEHGLTPDEMAVCTSCGLTPEQFAKAKPKAA